MLTVTVVIIILPLFLRFNTHAAAAAGFLRADTDTTGGRGGEENGHVPIGRSDILATSPFQADGHAILFDRYGPKLVCYDFVLRIRPIVIYRAPER